jgi:subfamily B ATP-binding cassette protein MsbA
VAPAPLAGIHSRPAWREARQLLFEHRRSLAIGLSLMLVSRLAGLVLPASTKYLIDEVITRRQWQLLTPLALAAGLATLVQAAASFGTARVVSVAAQRAIMTMRQRVQEHVMRLPVAYFDSTRSGTVIARVMNDAEGVRNLVGTGLIQMAGGLVTATLALAVLFWLNWRLTLANLVFLALFGAAMARAFKRLRPLFRTRNEITAEVTGRLAESVGGIRIVKVYVAEDRESATFRAGTDRLFRNIAATITGASAVSSISTAVTGVIGVVIMLVGGRALAAGAMTLGDLVMYTFFMGLMSAPVMELANIGTQISEAFAGLDRVREILDLPAEDRDDAARAPLPRVTGRVQFEEVGFGYDPDRPVLHGISFQVPAGSTVALVGSSGSGKSTLISLLMAFHQPQRGRVLVDGADLAGVRRRDYRAQLGVVMQDNFLFEGTVADNIRFARPGASRSELEAAARIAHVDEFVEQFQDRYETVVGERGVKLSGGQRQRVAIARAILADPRILILDEATSSLDSESEALIRDGLRRLRAGRTTFVIAHRLSTIQSADQILVIEQGRIIERGVHAELLALGGRYRQLHDRQQDSELDRFINPGEDFTALPGAR